MKLIIIFLALISATIQVKGLLEKLLSENSKIKTVSKVINNVLEHFPNKTYVLNGCCDDIWNEIFLTSEKTFINRDLNREIIKNDKIYDSFLTTEANLILIDSAEIFNKFLMRSNIEKQTLIYIKNIKFENLERVFSNRHKYEKMPPFYFLLNQEKKFSLHKLVKYSEKSCGNWHLIKLNEFNKKKQIWTSQFNHEDFKKTSLDFYKCEVTFVTRNEVGFMETPNKNEKGSGIIFDLIIEMKKKTKFTEIFTQFYDQPHDILIFPISQSLISQNKRFTQTTTIKEDKFVLLATPMPIQMISNYEKFFKPFDKLTWTFLILTLSIAFISIQLINRLDKCYQNFIYGGQVSSPTLNLTAIIFGIRQTFNYYRLPLTTPARVMFILFMFFCLIFRTCFQKLSFEFLTSDFYETIQIDTLDGLIKHNYTIVTISSFDYSYASYLFMEANVVRVKDEDFVKTIDDHCYDSKSKLVFLMAASFYQLLSLQNCNFVIIPEIEMSDFITIGLNSDHALTNVAKETAQTMVESGVHLRYFQENKHEVFDELKYPRVLRISDIEHYLIIWMISIIAPVTAFIIELIIGKVIKKKSNTAKEHSNIDLETKIETNYCQQNNRDEEIPENIHEIYKIEEEKDYEDQESPEIILNDYRELLSPFTDDHDRERLKLSRFN